MALSFQRRQQWGHSAARMSGNVLNGGCVYWITMRTASTVLLVVALLGSPIFAQIDKGVELVNAKKYQEAEKILRDVVADEPDNARAHLYLGRALLGQNKADDAEP